MLKTQFVIILLSIPALSSASPWSQKVIRIQNQTTMAQVCKNVSQRIHTKVCKSVKKEDLEAPDKIKLTKLDTKTVQLKYKDATARLRQTDEYSTFLVNRKSLYLEEIGSDKDLKKKLSKLLGPENEAVLLPTLLFLLQNSEHQTCFEADRAVQNCAKVSEMELPALEKKSTQKLLSQGLEYTDAFRQSIHYLSPNQSQALQQCACENGLCGFPKQNLTTKVTVSEFDQCKKSLQKLKKVAKDIDLFDDYAKKVLSLHIKEKPRLPALFKEDSYKGK